MYVAERHAVRARRPRRPPCAALDWVTACSDDLRDRAIALGADADPRRRPSPTAWTPSGSGPTPASRAGGRRASASAPSDLVLFTAGRFVRKKGFEYLIDAVAGWRRAGRRSRLVIGGGGDLEAELRARAR